MKCPDCQAEMVPLVFTFFCPNDCDRKVQDEIDPEKTPKIIFWEDKLGFVGPPSPLDASQMTDEEFDRALDDLFIDMDGTD